VKAVRQENLVAVRLERGERLPDVLLELYTQYEATGAFIQGGIGMLADVELGYFKSPGQYDHKQFGGRYECLALQGNLSLYDGQPLAHLHAMLANEDYSVFGGHLFSAVVGLTLELKLTLLHAPARMYRVIEADSGLPSLLVE
jgi:uncharacterized protein